jgi:hypothetical protein
MKSRIKRKLRKNCILVVDINCIPPTWSADQWVNLAVNCGLAVYDSRKLTSTAPFPIRTVPSSNIKGYKLVNITKDGLSKKLKEYNERIVSV